MTDIVTGTIMDRRSHDAPAPAPFSLLGGPGSRLLAGPAPSAGPEDLSSHLARLGPLELDAVDPELLRRQIRESGLLGRGGAGFPTATKLDAAAAAGGDPLIVVNASEGEPASRKDHVITHYRPHLVLDGAYLAARSVGAREIVIYGHRSLDATPSPLERALAQRSVDGVSVRLVNAPQGYVAGETSAVVSFLEGRGAIPRRRALPAAREGVAGRPTVVNNAETVAHLALIGRFGASWFHEAGAPEAPGSTLVTLAGEVARPGTVVEVTGPCSFGEVIGHWGDVGSPRAVLLGGYEGTWLPWSVIRDLPVERHRLAAQGVSLGCGVVAVVSSASCGLGETGRLLRWLSSQSAGQCGPCINGLPRLAAQFDDLLDGRLRRRDLKSMRLLLSSLRGRGDCGHPTGVVTLVESALDTFDEELTRHLRGETCAPRPSRGFPLPGEER